ncbi:tautomerase family protein [Microlunatus flavus]|uniref:tautomerase family protein n=1 Tax=Microlunatus flavus TaxID=1036181 RepID=UPI000ACF001E|nr:tautomerase family protein [Microlunatus flavus]
MPLVRIDVVEGRDPVALRRLADVVQEVLEEVFAAPPRDRYQVIDEHPARNVILQDTGLGFERTDDRVLVQVFQQGRTAEQKKALYARLADRLEADCGVAPTDLVVSVAANSREDWSFGLGRAQFLEGDL